MASEMCPESSPRVNGVSRQHRTRIRTEVCGARCRRGSDLTQGCGRETLGPRCRSRGHRGSWRHTRDEGLALLVDTRGRVGSQRWACSVNVLPWREVLLGDGGWDAEVMQCSVRFDSAGNFLRQHLPGWGQGKPPPAKDTRRPPARGRGKDTPPAPSTLGQLRGCVGTSPGSRSSQPETPSMGNGYRASPGKGFSAWRRTRGSHASSPRT